MDEYDGVQSALGSQTNHVEMFYKLLMFPLFCFCFLFFCCASLVNYVAHYNSIFPRFIRRSKYYIFRIYSVSKWKCAIMVCNFFFLVHTLPLEVQHNVELVSFHFVSSILFCCYVAVVWFAYDGEKRMMIIHRVNNEYYFQ